LVVVLIINEGFWAEFVEVDTVTVDEEFEIGSVTPAEALTTRSRMPVKR
jgi:hypothetical protein